MSDLTIAVSEDTFRRLFNVARDNAGESTSGSEDLGPFTLSWAFGFRLEDGTVSLQGDGTVLVSELDVVYDPLQVSFGIDIPEICVGGWCIVPTPFGCAVRLPRICVFSANPDIGIHLDLGGLVTSELSAAFTINTQYDIDPGRTAAMTDLDAEDAGVPNKWQFYLDPVWLDFDPLDLPDTIGNILESAIESAIDAALFGLPGWVTDLIMAILGPVIDLIADVLDIGDDIDEWMSNILGVSIGLLDFVATIIADYFAARYPIFWVEDPYPILDYDGPLIPVKVPLRDVSVTVTDDEMILAADVGA